MKGWWLYLRNCLCTRTVTRPGKAAVSITASTGRMRNSINPVYLNLLIYVEKQVVVYQTTQHAHSKY